MPDTHDAEGLEHARNWFSLHAGHRLQCVNFFILATAALVAGFGTVLAAGRFGTAFVIGLVGATVTIVFNLMERRTKELVKAGEAAMKEFEARLSQTTGISAIALVDRVEKTRISRGASYSKAINMLQCEDRTRARPSLSGPGDGNSNGCLPMPASNPCLRSAARFFNGFWQLSAVDSTPRPPGFKFGGWSRPAIQLWSCQDVTIGLALGQACTERTRSPRYLPPSPVGVIVTPPDEPLRTSETPSLTNQSEEHRYFADLVPNNILPPERQTWD